MLMLVTLPGCSALSVDGESRPIIASAHIPGQTLRRNQVPVSLRPCPPDAADHIFIHFGGPTAHNKHFGCWAQPIAASLSIEPFEGSRWRLRRTRLVCVLNGVLVLGYYLFTGIPR